MICAGDFIGGKKASFPPKVLIYDWICLLVILISFPHVQICLYLSLAVELLKALRLFFQGASGNDFSNEPMSPANDDCLLTMKTEHMFLADDECLFILKSEHMFLADDITL